MTDDWQEVYDADRSRGAAPAGEPEEVLVILERGGAVVEAKGPGRSPRWDAAYPQLKTPMEAYADGWMSYCEGTENPYETTDLELSTYWEDGWADAEDFFGGEPCEDFIGDEPCQ